MTYTYVVTNTSPGSEDVSGSVVDDNGTPSDTSDDVTVGTFSKLAAGASQTFTHVFTVNTTTANSTRTNVATATATDSSGASATATATATVTGHDCAISITKTPSVTDVCNGSSTSVTYSYKVTNNSDSFSVSGTVTDDVYGIIGSFGPLAPNGGNATLTKTATVTGSVTNKGTATGTFNDAAGTSASAQASATVTGHTCTISLTKTPDKTTVCNGSNTQVTYTYVVKNTGDFFNVSGSVSDDNATPGNTGDDVSIGTFTGLTPGSSTSFTHAFTVNGTRTNIATASGTFNDPKPTTASTTASATVTGQNCAVGKLAPTGTTCSQFTSNTLPQLSGINYSDDGTGHISQNLNPGVFFYWTKVVAASSGSQTITITQANDGSPGDYHFAEAAGTALYNSSCTTISTSPTVGANVSFTANLTSGATYIAGVKYSAKTPAGQPVPTSTGTCDSVLGDVCYSFQTILTKGNTSTLVDQNLHSFVLTQGPVFEF